jgi:hypothetical protein
MIFNVCLCGKYECKEKKMFRVITWKSKESHYLHRYILSRNKIQISAYIVLNDYCLVINISCLISLKEDIKPFRIRVMEDLKA